MTNVRQLFSLMALLLFVLSPTLCIAQLATKPSTSLSNISQPTKWEYLVVSFGKVEFSKPIDDPSLSQAGLSKLVPYSKAGIITAEEGISIEHQLDTLGRFGWELIGTVGEIGGDQELLFKRPYDADHSRKEAKLIEEEGNTLAEVEAANAAKAASPSPTELVDLDEVEAEKALNEHHQAEEQRLKDAIGKVTGYTCSNITATSTAQTVNESKVVAEVTLDGTSTLLKGNTYRSSEADKFGTDVASVIYDHAGLVLTDDNSTRSTDEYLGPVQVIVHVIIKFGGEDHEVSTQRCGGKWPN